MSVEKDVSRVLVEMGLLDQRRFEELLRFAADTGMTLKEALVEQGGLEEKRVLDAFAAVLGVKREDDLSKALVPREFIEKVPIAFARGHNCVALGRQERLVRDSLVARIRPGPPGGRLCRGRE